MYLQPGELTIALKEWAVTIKALAQGRQVLVLRKGGIHREDRDFRMVYPEFLLYPTYEHQRRELLKPPYHGLLEETMAEDDVPDLVTIGYWARVTDLFQLNDEETLDRLSPYHIWADDYAHKRLHWRPRQPLTVALLRVFALQQPQALPVLEEYRGCKSWVDLGQEVPLGKTDPVLSDAEYEERAQEIRGILGATSSAGSRG